MQTLWPVALSLTLMSTWPELWFLWCATQWHYVGAVVWFGWRCLMTTTLEKRRASWWQLKYIFCIFTPNIGEDVQFDVHIFQMGWFNHQPKESCWTLAWKVMCFIGGHRILDSILNCSFSLKITPRKINMEPENTPLEEENNLPNHHFQVLCWSFGV